jgi:RNA polymerase sigma factor (sigma-70 family)
MLGSRSDAEDATQEILVKVITGLSGFAGHSALSTWVHTVAVRQLMAMRRSRAEQRAVPLDDLARLIDAGLEFGRTQPPPGPEELTLAREVRLSCTHGMLTALEREERLALVLVEVLGFDAAESAEIAGVSHDAMRKRLSRARTRLESFLQASCGVMNEAANCRCERQIPAKVSLGLTRDRATLTVLAQAPSHTVAKASRELQGVSRVLRADGDLFAPQSLRSRLESLLPTLLSFNRASSATH